MKHLSVLIVVLLFVDDVKFLILFCFNLGIFPSPKLLISLEVFSLIYTNGETGGRNQFKIQNSKFKIKELLPPLSECPSRVLSSSFPLAIATVEPVLSGAKKRITPNSKLQTPNSKLQTPNSQLPTPNSQLPTPNSQLPTPNSKLLTPNS